MKATDENANGDLPKKRQRNLAAEVLKQAARDLQRFRSTTSEAGRKIYRDAYRWLTANEVSWPFSFLNVCQALSLAPESVRAQLTRDPSSSNSCFGPRKTALGRMV